VHELGVQRQLVYSFSGTTQAHFAAEPPTAHMVQLAVQQDAAAAKACTAPTTTTTADMPRAPSVAPLTSADGTWTRYRVDAADAFVWHNLTTDERRWDKDHEHEHEHEHDSGHDHGQESKAPAASSSFNWSTDDKHSKRIAGAVAIEQ
jgi:hypothetical protein